MCSLSDDDARTHVRLHRQLQCIVITGGQFQSSDGSLERERLEIRRDDSPHPDAAAKHEILDPDRR